MVQSGAMAPMGPTTVMGQIMGALNTGLAEDLNIESLEHGFDCNVDEVSEFEDFMCIERKFGDSSFVDRLPLIARFVRSNRQTSNASFPKYKFKTIKAFYPKLRSLKFYLHAYMSHVISLSNF